MKITCTKENLLKGVRLVERVVGKNMSLPVLNNILLEAEEGRLKLSSTNLEVGLICWVGGKIEKEGKTTVPVKILSGLINGTKGEKIELFLDGGVLKVKSSGMFSEVRVVDPAEFPLIPKIDKKPFLEVDSEVLSKNISRVLGMCATSESRPEISGIFFALNQKGLVVAATDGFRLAESVEKNVKGENFGVILPRNTANEVVRVGGEIKGKCQISMDENQILFKFGGVNLVSRLIEGRYPEYTSVIPEKIKNKGFLNKRDLLQAVRSVGLFADKKTSDIKLKIDTGEKKLKLWAVSSETGKGEIEVGFEKIEGGDVEVVYNFNYLLDGLANIETEIVEIGINSKNEPGVFKPKKEGYLFVVMPIDI
jgi:DNA polymerase-3 subunit beta